MTGASHPKLQIKRVSKKYGDAVALLPSDLDVKQGEFLTLLGPSGSGKTTLLMMIAGLTLPSEGQILIDSLDVTSTPSHKRNIGVVFQNYALFPHMTVAENIAFPLRMRKWPAHEIDAAVHDAMAVVRLGSFGNRLPAQLSGGQQQRVALARAIVFKPALVLMDEPLGALDKKLRDELKDEIRRLHKQLGATIIYVTHDQEEAMVLSDRITLMDQAKIVQVDSPSALYNLPKTVFAADFLGESNILKATVLGDGGQLEFRLQSEDVRLPVSSPENLRIGSGHSLMIRPERIRILPADSTSKNKIAIDVSSVVNIGSIFKVIGRLAGGTEIRISVPGQKICQIQEGERIFVDLPADDLVVLGAQ